jgi:hypothetical protein
VVWDTVGTPSTRCAVCLLDLRPVTALADRAYLGHPGLGWEIAPTLCVARDDVERLCYFRLEGGDPQI